MSSSIRLTLTDNTTSERKGAWRTNKTAEIWLYPADAAEFADAMDSLEGTDIMAWSDTDGGDANTYGFEGVTLPQINDALRKASPDAAECMPYLAPDGFSDDYDIEIEIMW